MVYKPRFQWIFLALIFYFAGLPVYLFAAEAQPVTGGLVEIENNRLYMIYAGKEDGLQIGDTAVVMRDNLKIAELRLTSVLADSSVAEVTKLSEENKIEETDLAVFSRVKSAAVPQAAEEKSSPEPVVETAVVALPSAPVPADAAAVDVPEKPAVSVETPEVKEQPVPAQEDWQSQIQALNDQLAQMKTGREKEMGDFNARIAEKDALIDALSKEKSKLSFSLEQEAKEITALKKDMEQLKKETAAAKTFSVSGAKSSATDPFEKRVEKINQNLTTLQRQCQEEISLAREEARQGLFAEYDRWQQKINDTQTAYEEQMEKQRQFIKERQAEIEALKNERFGLAAELGDRDQQMISLKKERDSLASQMESLKGDRSEKLRITQQSLEQKIGEFTAMEEAYKEKIKTLETGVQQKTSESDGKWQEKLKAVQAEYEAKLNDQKLKYEEQLDNGQIDLKKKNAELNGQLSQMKETFEKESVVLKSRLEEKEKLLGSLMNEKKDLADNFARSEADAARLTDNLKKLEGELKTVKTTRDAEIKSAVASLEKEIAFLRQEKAETTRTHEAKIVSLENTLKETAKKTDEQTGKLRAENTRLSSLLDGKEKELASVRAANAQLEEMKAPLEEKIEGLNKVLISLEGNYKEKMAQALAETEQKHAQAQAEAEAQLKSLQESKDKETAALKADLNGRDSQIAALTQEKKNLLTDIEHNAQQMERSRQQVEDLTRDLEGVRVSREAQIQSAKEPLEKKIESLTAEAFSLKKAHEDELNRIRAESQATLTARLQEKEAQLQEQKRSVEEQTASLQKDAQEKIAQLTAQMRDLEKNKDSYIATLIAELKDKQVTINALNADKTALGTDLNRTTEELAGLKEEASVTRKELELTKTAQAEALRLAKLPLEERIEGLNNELIFLTKGYEEKILAQERQLRQEILLKETDGKTKLDEAIAAHEAKLAQQGQSWEDQLNSRQAKSYEEIARLKTQYEDLKSQTDRKVLTMVAELDEKQALIKNLEQGKSELAVEVDQNNKELLKLNQDLGSLTEELKNTRNVQAERMQAVKSPLEEEIKKLTGNLNALKKDHQMQLAAANEHARKELVAKEKQRQSEIAMDQEKSGIELAKKQQEIDALKNELASLNKLKDGQAVSLEAVVKEKDNQIGVLRKEKSDLAFDLEQAKTQLNKVKEELAADRANVSEKIRLAKDPLEKETGSLNAKLASLKQEYEYKTNRVSEDFRRQMLESDRQWEARLAKITDQYENEIIAQKGKLQAQFLEEQNVLREEITALSDELMRLKDAKESEIFAMQVDYEDRLAALKEESGKPTEPSSQGLSSSASPAAAPAVSRASSTPQESSDSYYTMIRETILDNFRKFNFLDYRDKEDYVKIEFELFSNGSLKEQPQFFGARDEKLKELLYQHFMEALPFPPFPENIKKKSQRFTIVISFKN